MLCWPHATMAVIKGLIYLGYFVGGCKHKDYQAIRFVAIQAATLILVSLPTCSLSQASGAGFEGTGATV